MKRKKEEAYFYSVVVNRIMYGAFIYPFIFQSLCIIYSGEKCVEDLSILESQFDTISHFLLT